MSCAKSKAKPGPRPTSCLTCRQRRKKCDLSRPHCGRCLKSGFECLGYGDDEFRGRGSNPVPPPILPVVPAQAASLEASDCGGIDSSETPQDLSSVGNSRNSCPPILAAALICELNGCLAAGKEDQTSTHSSEYFNRLWPQDQTQPVVYRRVPFGSSSNTGKLGQAAGVISRDNCLSRIIEALRWTLPPAVDGKRIIRDNHFAHIIYEYRFQRCNLWFMTPPTSIRDLLIDRLKVSKTMMWTMWLGTKLFEAVSRDPRGEMVRECIGWMDKLEQGFTTDSHGNPPLHHIADRLLTQLELAYLKFTTIGSASGYALLQKALPRFLQVVAADPTFFMEHPDGNLVVSFPRAISSPQHELERFIIYDTASSFLFGVPPLVEYGYEENYHGVSHGFEWIHGIPFTLVETISQINSWRAGSRVAPLDNWEGLERRVLAWQPQPAALEDEENTLSSVARLAVQESWRHVVLIYLYMGMCGVSSHDSRVQASIRQIIRLSETVADLPIGIHMFTHCLVAGIGARLEKYRSLIRERLLSFKDTRVWLFRGPQFSKVLDHLWHGVGAGGEPVMWDDYVHSRCVVVPI